MNIARRGPTRSTQVPNKAADRPSITIAIREDHADLGVTRVEVPSSWVLYTLVAYACPIHRWIANAAGGINHLL